MERLAPISGQNTVGSSFDDQVGNRLIESMVTSQTRKQRDLRVRELFVWLDGLTASPEATKFVLSLIEQETFKVIRYEYGESCHTRAVKTLLRFGYPHALQLLPDDLVSYRINTKPFLFRPLHDPRILIVGLLIPVAALLVVLAQHL